MQTEIAYALMYMLAWSFIAQAVVLIVCSMSSLKCPDIRLSHIIIS